MEVAPGIHRIQTPFGDRFVCLYLLVGSECALLLDTGVDSTPGEYLVPYLHEIGLAADSIRYVVNSHADFDHTAGNQSVVELTSGAIFMCHQLDLAQVEDIELMISDRYGEYAQDHGIADPDEALDFIRNATRTCPIDVSLSGGESIRLGPEWTVEVWHTPGHSHGHISLYDPRGHNLVIADATLYNAVLRADGQPALPPTYRYVDTYLASMQRIAAAKPNLLLTSHYPVYAGRGIAEFMSESRAFVDRVDQALVNALATEHTLKELTNLLSPDLGEWPVEANAYACFPLLGHLERLVLYDRAETGRRDGLLTYKLK
jgi:glyoxylase-like metal-dependent hydrolase (beta-lactamase superfamily II)